VHRFSKALSNSVDGILQTTTRGSKGEGPPGKKGKEKRQLKRFPKCILGERLETDCAEKGQLGVRNWVRKKLEG